MGLKAKYVPNGIIQITNRNILIFLLDLEIMNADKKTPTRDSM